MIMKVLSKLFGADYAGRYNPHPFHVITYPILLMAVGTYCAAYYQWYAFGFMCFILGSLLGIAIILALGWEKTNEYWIQINEHIRLLLKAKDPEVFAHLGYKKLPGTITISEEIDNGQGFKSTKVKTLPVHALAMQQIADKVLMSKSYDFTQELYGSLVPNWRKFHSEMKKLGYIVPKNKKNVRNGYMLNKKGHDVMYQYASEAIRTELKKGGLNAR